MIITGRRFPMGSLKPSLLMLVLVPFAGRGTIWGFTTRGELFFTPQLEPVTPFVSAGKYCSSAHRGRTGTCHGVPTINHEVRDQERSVNWFSSERKPNQPGRYSSLTPETNGFSRNWFSHVTQPSRCSDSDRPQPPTELISPVGGRLSGSLHANSPRSSN